MRKGDQGSSAGAGRNAGEVLGAVLAGGHSRRFGGPKALYALSGQPMAEWALRALRPHTSRQVVLTHDPEVVRVLDIPGRPDSTPGLGPLGGLLTALEWADELGMERLFLLACDLPLVGPELVGQILTQWPHGSPASVPCSVGPLGFEPLCAAYSAEVLPVVRRVAGSSDRAMERLLGEVGAPPLFLEGRTEEELALAFTNVNTRDEARRAEELLRSFGPQGGGRPR